MTRKTLEKLSEADAMAADEAVTDAYAEHLKSEGVSSDMAETFKKQSANSRTSKASAVEHAVKVMSEYGNAIKAKVEKVVGRGKAQSSDTDIATKLETKSKFTETELKSMDTTQLQNIVTQLAPKYRESLKSVGLNSNIVDTQVDAMVSSQDVMELVKSADVMQKELGLKDNVQITADETNVFENELNDDRIDTNNTSVFSTNQEVFDALKQTEIFRDRDVIEHVLLGDVKNRQAKGFHYEGMPEPIGRIVPGTEFGTDSFGVYKAQVEINGIKKKSNEGYSTFFPKHWSPQEIVDAINEAYDSKKYIVGNTYSGTTNNGITIEMYLDKKGKIISAYPIYMEVK